jgi:hypothetical protein
MAYRDLLLTALTYPDATPTGPSAAASPWPSGSVAASPC